MSSHKVYGWAIVGTGLMGKLFPPDLKARPTAKIVSIISRSITNARALAKLHGIDESCCFDDFDKGVNRPEVDVVYIGTPPSEHAWQTKRAASFGKAVLCEKPFVVNAEEARDVIEYTRKRNVVLVEALFSHWTPVWRQLRDLLRNGEVGRPLSLTCAIGIPQSPSSAPTLFDPKLGGGALGAVGVYCLSLAWLVFGEMPSSFEGKIVVGSSGVDETNDVTFHYANGGKAEWQGFISKRDARSAFIKTDKAEIEIEAPWWYPPKINIRVDGKLERSIEVAREGKGYGYEADEVHKLIEQGKLESEHFSLDMTQQIMELMDKLRAKLTVQQS